MLAFGGVDGCPAGWLLARTPAAADTAEFAVYGSFRELLASADDLALIAVDIPIGLSTDGPRPTDQAARAALGPRRSSVFPSPVRAALSAHGYAEACELSFAACGKKLSKQAFAILPKIREVDHALRSDARAAALVKEVHPEVSFSMLNGGIPLGSAKKSREGAALRRTLVESEFPGSFAAARQAFTRKDVSSDDILDALAALWSAARIHRGIARHFPQGEAQLDACGLPMRISA